MIKNLEHVVDHFKALAIGDYIESEHHDLIKIDFGEEYPQGDPYYLNRRALRRLLDFNIERWPMTGYLIEDRKDLRKFLSEDSEDTYYVPTSKFRAISRAVEKRSKGALDRALSLDRPLIIDTTMPSPLYRTVMLNPPEFAVAMLAAGYPYKGFMTRALQTEREYYNIFDSIYKAWRVPLQYELIPFIPPQKLKRYRDMNAYGHDERTQKRFDRYIQRYEASKKSKK